MVGVGAGPAGAVESDSTLTFMHRGPSSLYLSSPLSPVVLVPSPLILKHVTAQLSPIMSSEEEIKTALRRFRTSEPHHLGAGRTKVASFYLFFFSQVFLLCATSGLDRLSASLLENITISAPV